MSTDRPASSDDRDWGAEGLAGSLFDASGRAVHRNLSTPRLIEEAIQRREGRLAEGGALVVDTGQHTGRSPNDKFVVREPTSEDRIWWGDVNQPIDGRRYAALRDRVLAHLGTRDIFVEDCFVGSEPRHRLSIRIVAETAWHALFARTMFVTVAGAGGESGPDFTVLHAPSCRAMPEIDGTRSEVFVVLNFAERVMLIGGTAYAGEVKKSVFTLLNYLMPQRDVLPMHCSANAGPDGDVALFFGLSGTGKTTLSADASRMLIGDDEHGWSDDGVFNFEGGCYAKAIRLSNVAEPQIYAATHAFGTILENVGLAPESGTIDLDDDSVTENTRAAYPLSAIPNALPGGTAGHPRTIFMLTADAFGVLPPIARLTADQAMYHFLSGYTAKVAGTERDVVEPTATFSACFGAPFLPLPPGVYANLLGERIDRHDVVVWLVNTGWTGGPVGTGDRIEIAYTRAMIGAALAGELARVPMTREPVFGFDVPAQCPGVPPEILAPRGTWADGEAYDAQRRELAAMFVANAASFGEALPDAARMAGPILPAMP
ncbi:MAG: phosphoenolpyruvate carboxykinase (ATP) [Chloroflexota bacterium]|nr:phosphoenolpyruvate carboxykinase (ATP) [Chloroflexota bacterium]